MHEIDIIKNKYSEYCNLIKQKSLLSKQVKEINKKALSLDNDIKEYMTLHKLDTVSTVDGDIYLYDKKINMKYKKESMLYVIKKIVDESKAENIVNSIINNEIYDTKKSLKTKIK